MKNEHSRIRRQQRGQAATEFIIIGTLFLGMLGGLIEMTYVARAKILLNYATFDAARSGAVNNASVAQMAITLQQDMAPLYMQTNRTQAALLAATNQAKSVYNTMAAAGNATLKPLIIISPTQDIFNRFSELQDVHLAGQTTEAVQTVLPNDNLQWRDRTTQNVTVGGTSVAINVQDANLLKIKAYWCQHLVVPGLEVLVHSIITSTDFETPAQLMCEAVGAQQNDFYIAIESDAVMPMQSPIVSADLP
jgi:Flp pilus assembly protein TadG